jgi:hypothetical protein
MGHKSEARNRRKFAWCIPSVLSSTPTRTQVAHVTIDVPATKPNDQTIDPPASYHKRCRTPCRGLGLVRGRHSRTALAEPQQTTWTSSEARLGGEVRMARGE